ncbi:MAG: AzlD domain-containing protein [Candidatus Heimdallarchaeota archaeon]|nr:AzlD domain-containing protein [Candidatus Heimdallarchaeota archaeon]
MTSDSELLLAFIIIGIATFSMRALFFFYHPNFINKKTIKDGLNSIPSSLLVVLVIPFALFENLKFLPFRLEVYAIFIAGIFTVLTKKPGLSLGIALIAYEIFNLVN